MRHHDWMIWIGVGGDIAVRDMVELHIDIRTIARARGGDVAVLAGDTHGRTLGVRIDDESEAAFLAAVRRLVAPLPVDVLVGYVPEPMIRIAPRQVAARDAEHPTVPPAATVALPLAHEVRKRTVPPGAAGPAARTRPGAARVPAHVHATPMGSDHAAAR